MECKLTIIIYNRMTCICSAQNAELMAALGKQGFTFPSELIVLERDF